MKQFQIAYRNDESFHQELAAIQQWCDTNPTHTMVFRIYSQDMDIAPIKHICEILDEKMPDALYLGCTSHANIQDGALATTKISLSCTVFEHETTQVKLLQFPFSEQNAKEAVQALKAFCEANPWVNAVEMHATILGMSMRGFCDEMSTLRRGIQVFGGGACNPNPDDSTTIVFSKGNGFSSRSIVFLLLGGSDFHTYSTYISGWKALKRKFKVTKAHREILYELDGEPAFRIYQKFLNISRNDKLVSNTLEFPLFMDDHGIDVLRCLLGVNDDGSIVLATEVAEGTDVRLAFGDPKTILSSIRHDGQNIANFQPEVIQAFSCAARRTFWGDENIGDETILLNGVAPTSGFYTSGEFLRLNGALYNFNITLVLVAMREGEPKKGEILNIYDAKLDNIDSETIPLIRRFVSFIDASTTELAELNRKLELSSITDGLTGLLNRTEIERRIRSTLDEHTGKLSLIMLDIDDFKQINDIYGHREGDHVIIAMADVLKSVMDDMPSSSLGRWGGEEFMVLLPGSDIHTAAALAEKMRAAFAAVTYDVADRQTVSIGVVQAKNSENADALYTRVDRALYLAKERGKNQVVTLD